MKFLFISFFVLVGSLSFAQEKNAEKKAVAESSIASLLYLPKLGQFSVSLNRDAAYVTTQLKSTTSSSYVDLDITRSTLRFEGVVGLSDSVALNLAISDSDQKADVQPSGGTTTTSKSKGISDFAVGATYRFIDRSQGRSFALQASLKYHPKIGESRTASATQDGTLATPYPYITLESDILGGRGIWEYDGKVFITPSAKGTSVSSTGVSSDVSSSTIIGVSFASQFNFTSNFSLLGKVGLAIAGTSETTSSAGTKTTEDTYGITTMEVGIKYLFTENLFLTSGLSIEAYSNHDSTTGTTKSNYADTSQSTLKIVGLTYGY